MTQGEEKKATMRGWGLGIVGAVSGGIILMFANALFGAPNEFAKVKEDAHVTATVLASHVREYEKTASDISEELKEIRRLREEDRKVLLQIAQENKAVLMAIENLRPR